MTEGTSGWSHARSSTELVCRLAVVLKESAVESREGRWNAANRAYDRAVAILKELRQRGPDALTEVLVLLDDPDLSVRVGAATWAIAFAPEAAIPVLRAAANGPPSLSRLGAEAALMEYDRGKLRDF